MLKTSAHRLARSRSERRNERRQRPETKRGMIEVVENSTPRRVDRARKTAKSAPRPAVVCGAAALGSGALQICSQETLAASQRLLRAPSSLSCQLHLHINAPALPIPHALIPHAATSAPRHQLAELRNREPAVGIRAQRRPAQLTLLGAGLRPRLVRGRLRTARGAVCRA